MKLNRPIHVRNSHPPDFSDFHWEWILVIRRVVPTLAAIGTKVASDNGSTVHWSDGRKERKFRSMTKGYRSEISSPRFPESGLVLLAIKLRLPWIARCDLAWFQS